MVKGIPEITVTHDYNLLVGQPDTDRIWGICVECTKGPSYEPEMVQSAAQMFQKFKMRLDGFWGVGGQGLIVTRVTAGTPVKAKHLLKDDSATPSTILELEAKEEGSYPIYITFNEDLNERYNLIVEEAGMPTEYYLGLNSMEHLKRRINSDSRIITADNDSEPGDGITSVPRTQLGSGGGNTSGSDGKTKTGTDEPGDYGELAEADLAEAHRAGLKTLEYLRIKGVFTISPNLAVQAEYAVHAQTMSSSENNRWRYAVVGAPEGTIKSEMLSMTAGYNHERVMFVGQGLIDRNGREYAPNEATMAIAGKRSQLWYGRSMWGGASIKRLGINESQFFVDTLPIVGPDAFITNSDLRDLNEGGVITFEKSTDGVRIREGINTVQATNVDAQDTESVVGIITRALEVIYNASYQMLGENITPSFKTDLEEHIKSQLSIMQTVDKTLTEDEDEGLEPYSIEVTIVPRSNQRLGRVSVAGHITPVFAARKIPINVSVV